MNDEKEERKIGPVYKVYSQDLYVTDMHSEEIGIRQDEVWRSKSRQFSADAEIIGKIEEAVVDADGKLPDKEKTGFIILRNSLWEDEPNEFQRRLVLKLFTNSGGWIATAEEMVAQEVANSFASDEPLIALSVFTRDNEFITRLQQVNRGKLTTESYSFFLLGPNKTFDIYRIEGIRGSAGDDYRVIKLSGGETVAEIDSKFGDLGGEFEVKIKDPVLAKNQWFCRILQCFSVVVKYRTKMQDKIRKIMKAISKGEEEIYQDRFELSLLVNPRKLALDYDEFDDI